MKSIKKRNISSTRLTEIANQLRRIYDGDPWYGSPITSILKSLEPEIVFRLQKNGAHSIAELLTHMITYREFVEKRLQGDDKYLPDQEESFNWKKFSIPQEEVYDKLISRLETNQQHLLTLLRKADDSILEQKVAGKLYSFKYLLNGIIQHDLYHLGQIVYINRMHKVDHNFRNVQSYEIFSYEQLSLVK